MRGDPTDRSGFAAHPRAELLCARSQELRAQFTFLHALWLRADSRSFLAHSRQERSRPLQGRCQVTSRWATFELTCMAQAVFCDDSSLFRRIFVTNPRLWGYKLNDQSAPPNLISFAEITAVITKETP